MTFSDFVEVDSLAMRFCHLGLLLLEMCRLVSTSWNLFELMLKKVDQMESVVKNILWFNFESFYCAYNTIETSLYKKYVKVFLITDLTTEYKRDN